MMMFRADDDLDPEVAERMRLVGTVQHQTGEWFIKAVIKWARLITAIGGAGLLLGGIAVAMGWRLASPGDGIEETNRRIARLDSVHQALSRRVTEGDADRADIRRAVEENVYLTCEVLRAVSPPGSVRPRSCPADQTRTR